MESVAQILIRSQVTSNTSSEGGLKILDLTLSHETSRIDMD